MPPESVQWAPAAVVLLAGLALGLLAAWRLRRAPHTEVARAAPAEALDLEARRDALLEQIRELEDTAAKRTPEQLAAERARLELEAALAWRNLDRVAGRAPERERAAAARKPARVAEEKAPAPPRAPTAPASAMRGFLWGVGAAGAVGLLLFLVTRSATERPEGGSPTGNTPGESGAPAAVDDPERTALEQRIARDPADIEARLQLAELALRAQDMMAVFEQTRAVLERSPGEPRALSYQALVRLAMGQPEIAVRMLKEALERDPGLIDAYLHLAFVYVQMGKKDEAGATVQAAARQFPERAEQLRNVLAEMERRAAGQEPVVQTAEDPHANVAESPPGAEASPGGPPAGAPGANAASGGPGKIAGGGGAEGGTGSISGVLELDPGARSTVAPGALVFVVVRPAGAQGGAPLAVKRLVATSFPLRFEVGAADSMMGEALPERLRVEARVDSDGDPMTRAPQDPKATVDPVTLGARGLRLVLRREGS